MFKSVPLSSLMLGRNNNFDVLRFFAASLVVFCHSFMFCPLGNAIDPLSSMSGGRVSFGGLAVAVFFVISGFLITMSYENSAGKREFMLKRALRIFPGLAVVVFFSAFVVGPLLTSYSLPAYFLDVRTYAYVGNVLLFRMQDGLPGVFAHNALPNEVNGSLWTLWYEFVCYLLVLGLGMVGMLRWKPVLILLCAVFLLTFNWADVPVVWRINNVLSLIRWQEDYLEFIPYFAGGALVYLLRDRMPVSPFLMLTALLVLLLTLKTDVFSQVFAILGSYLIIGVAYCRRLQFGNFAKKGDFSYGMYIYAFPVQQAVSQFSRPDAQWLENFFISYPIVLLFAVASWHWVESPALAMKKRLHALFIG